jgi:hypothetical protein
MSQRTLYDTMDKDHVMNGGRKLPKPYNDDLFHWWVCHIIDIDDYPYEGIKLNRYLDIHVPPSVSLGQYR